MEELKSATYTGETLEEKWNYYSATDANQETYKDGVLIESIIFDKNATRITTNKESVTSEVAA